MPQYISVSTRDGTRMFDLDDPILFMSTTFPTYEEACTKLATLDERCFPLLREASDGGWAILVHSQKQPEDLTTGRSIKETLRLCLKTVAPWLPLLVKLLTHFLSVVLIVWNYTGGTRDD